MSIFEKLLKGEIPCSKVFEDDNVLAFHDINPQAPIHVLVIPKRKAVSLGDLGGWDVVAAGSYLQSVAMVAGLLGLEKNGYRVVFNNGADGGQTVPYLHAHILGGRALGGFE